jgi:histone acetyltransferase (RNA polymerase elongator complex component)
MPGGTFTSEDIDKVIEVLHYVKFVRSQFASGPEGVKRVQEAAAMLREAGRNTNTRPWIVFADAIEEALRTGPID